jgi:hypothetical protein
MPDIKTLLTPLMRWFMFAMVLANIAGSMYTILLPIYLTARRQRGPGWFGFYPIFNCDLNPAGFWRLDL